MSFGASQRVRCAEHHIVERYLLRRAPYVLVYGEQERVRRGILNGFQQCCDLPNVGQPVFRSKQGVVERQQVCHTNHVLVEQQ